MDNKLPVWELLQKKIVWEQLSFLNNMKILDFGSGNGATADHFAENNEVVAVEPSEDMIAKGDYDSSFIQLVGSVERLKEYDSGCFDAILCHNVLEYVLNREEILSEFSRLLKKDGLLSVLKHNKNGRVMQMVVLLNNFEHAQNLLDGGNCKSKDFGAINYYDNCELTKWCSDFELEKTLCLRTFWDLQQNQEIQQDEKWQEKMIEIERRVEADPDFQKIAFFNHLFLRKK